MTTGTISGSGPQPETEENDCPPFWTVPSDDVEDDEPTGRNQRSRPAAIHHRRPALAKTTMTFRLFMTNRPCCSQPPANELRPLTTKDIAALLGGCSNALLGQP